MFLRIIVLYRKYWKPIKSEVSRLGEQIKAYRYTVYHLEGRHREAPYGVVAKLNKALRTFVCYHLIISNSEIVHENASRPN